MLSAGRLDAGAGANEKHRNYGIDRPEVRLVHAVEGDHLLVTDVAVDKREGGVVDGFAMARRSAAATALTTSLRDRKRKQTAR